MRDNPWVPTSILRELLREPESVALRAELRETVRIALTSAFVDPGPWLEGRGFEAPGELAPR